MGKKVYGKPLMFMEKFVPQEYCAPCGDGTTMVTYNFKCDAGGGSSYNVYIDNGDGIFDSRDDSYIGNFYACRSSHSVTVPKGQSIDNIFPKGFIGRNELQYVGPGMFDWDYVYVTTPVRVWRGEDGNNIHCSTSLTESEYTPHYSLS